MCYEIERVRFLPRKKGTIVKTLAEMKPVLLGAVGGAIALALLGFNVFGWTSAGTAAETAKDEATAAVVDVLSPICASQFNADDNATGKLAELKALTSYRRRDFIEEGGWATMPGSDKPVTGVSRGCASLLIAS